MREERTEAFLALIASCAAQADVSIACDAREQRTLKHASAAPATVTAKIYCELMNEKRVLPLTAPQRPVTMRARRRPPAS